MRSFLTIGQVAKKVGLPTKTIRYYEEIALLPPAKRLENAYREYSDEDIKRLRFIKQVRTLGLSLNEIKLLVIESFEGTCEHLRSNLLMQLPQYIDSTKKRINDLQALQNQLQGLQKSIKTLPLTHPNKHVRDKGYCEVLEHFEKSLKEVNNYGV